MKYIMVFFALAGCATPEAIVAKAVDAQIAQMAKPTFSVELSDAGAVKKIEYHDPRDRQGIQLPTNGWDFAKSVVGSAERVTLGAAPWAAVGTVAVKGLLNSGHNSQSSNVASGAGASAGGGSGSFVDHSGSSSNSSEAASGAGSSTGGDGGFTDNSGQASATTTTTTTTTNANTTQGATP